MDEATELEFKQFAYVGIYLILAYVSGAAATTMLVLGDGLFESVASLAWLFATAVFVFYTLAYIGDGWCRQMLLRRHDADSELHQIHEELHA